MMVKIKALWAKITGCTLATIDQAKLDLAQAEAKLKAEVAALAAKIGTEDAVIAAKFKVMEAAGKVEAAKVGTEATTIWAKFAAAPSWLQGVIFLAVLAVPSLLFYQCDKKPQAAAPQVFASIPPISAAAHVPLVEVPVAKGLIQVLEKKALSKKLKLPKVISDDTNAQVVATATLPAGPGYDVIAFTNVSTGASSLVAEPKKRPLFAFEGTKEIGARYGIATGSITGQEADVYAKYNVLRVGNAHLGLYGEVAAQPTVIASKVMVDVSYRW